MIKKIRLISGILFVPMIVILGRSNNETFLVADSSIECKFYYDTINHCNVFLSVDSTPTYKGEVYLFAKELMENIDLKKMDKFQTSINLEYIIDTCGIISWAGIVNKKKEDLSNIEIEALRAVELLKYNRWIPGKCNNKKVPVKLFNKIRLSPLSE